MKAHICEKSPLKENRLTEQQVNMYIFLACLHERYGFGKQRLTVLLEDFAENKSQYNKIRIKEGKWSADSQLLRMVEESFDYKVDIGDLIGKEQ